MIPTPLIPIQPPGHYPNHPHLSHCNSSGAKHLEPLCTNKKQNEKQNKKQNEK
jgi:hypothetical protein